MRSRSQLARTVGFDEYVEEIRALHDAADAEEKDAKPAKGACLIKSSAMGGSVCIRTTAAACKAMKGVFIGGPCGG
jgi:hypothetical protein